MKKINRSVTGITFLLLFYGFITTISYSAETPTKKDSTSEKIEKATGKKGDFLKGAQLWANNCARCHNYRSPKDYRDELWKPVLYHMRLRAGLTGQETLDILEFLQKSN